MLRQLLPTLSVACALSLSSAALAAASQKDQLVDFLKSHVQGVVLHSEINSSLQGGQVQSRFAMDQTFANLKVSGTDVTIDIISTIKQRLQDVDAEGNPTSAERVRDRINVSRLTFTQMQSSGKLLGKSEWLSSTLGSHTTALPGTFAAEVKDGKLILKWRSGLYNDFFASGGGYYPGVSEGTVTYFVKDGKLHTENVPTQVYQVDPETLERDPLYMTEGSSAAEINRYAVE